MTDIKINDYLLDQYAKECAADIVADIDLSDDETLEDHRDDMTDQAHEWADQSEWVIYYAYTHALCANCNTDAGEEFLEDVGNPDPCTYDALAAAIAYGELRYRIENALNELIEGAE